MEKEEEEDSRVEASSSNGRLKSKPKSAMREALHSEPAHFHYSSETNRKSPPDAKSSAPGKTPDVNKTSRKS